MENDNNRYVNGKIYCLRSHQTDDIYIGSTIQPLYKRLHQHKKEKLHILSNYDDMYIELIEEYPCKNKMELFRKEGEHIRANDCVNKKIEGRTKSEYYIDNKDKVLERSKEYYIDNKDKVLERSKEYYIDNKDKILEQRKQYCIDNKDKISEQRKQYRIAKKQSTSSFSPVIQPTL